MPSIESWSISTCRRFVRLFARPRKRTTSCLRLFWESSIATRSASRPLKETREKSDVPHEETYFAKSSPEGCGSGLGVAVPGRNGSCRHSSGANSCVAKAPNGLLLPGSWRGHAQHVAWPGHGQMDTQRLGRQFQTQPDSYLARTVQEVRVVLRESRERVHGRLGSQLYGFDVAQLYASGHRPCSGAHGCDSRSGDFEDHQPGHTAPVAGSVVGNDRSTVGG